MPQRRLSNEEGCLEDSITCSIYQQQETLTKNKNKVPRSVRYELEDALVGLCDAWFDEIKPHLVRNNIKLHIGGSSAGEAKHCAPTSQSGSTAGPPSTDDCTHLDPASSPNCKLCQLLVTAASCIESAARQAAGVAPSSPFALDFSTTDNSRSSSDSDTQLRGREEDGAAWYGQKTSQVSSTDPNEIASTTSVPNVYHRACDHTTAQLPPIEHYVGKHIDSF